MECYCGILTNLHSPFSLLPHCISLWDLPPLATRLKTLVAFVIQGSAFTAQSEDINFRHKLGFGRILKSHCPVIAALTNQHKLGGLKQKQTYYFTILEVRSSKWVIRAAFYLDSVVENLFPWPLKCLEADWFLGLWPLFLSWKAAT